MIHLIYYRLSNTLLEKSSYNFIYFIVYILIFYSIFIKNTRLYFNQNMKNYRRVFNIIRIGWIMKEGENIEYYDTGEIRSKINYSDVEYHVEYIEYYKSGFIKYKCNYLDGKLNLEYIGYYMNGDILYKCNYLHGKLHGEFIEYYENSEIISKSYYINNELVTYSEWLSYNRNLKFKLIGL